jgi:hypothetical protein
VPEKVCQGQTL